jgi:glutamine amidotransferase
MCELFGWSSSAPGRPEPYLRAFRARGGETAGHEDGWGLAFLADGAFRIEKEPSPAFRSARFASLAGELKTDLILGHVRKADFPPVRSLANTHPFLHQCCDAVWAFAHNGLVPGAIRRSRLVAPVVCQADGDTDSEHAFCLVLEALSSCHAGGDAMQRPACLNALAHAAGAVATFGKFNFLLSDGERLFAYCHDRLHALECSSAQARSVVLATQPLSNEDWKAFQPGELRVYRAGSLVADNVSDSAAIEGSARGASMAAA